MLQRVQSSAAAKRGLQSAEQGVNLTETWEVSQPLGPVPRRAWPGLSEQAALLFTGGKTVLVTGFKILRFCSPVLSLP